MQAIILIRSGFLDNSSHCDLRCYQHETSNDWQIQTYVSFSLNHCDGNRVSIKAIKLFLVNGQGRMIEIDEGE